MTPHKCPVCDGSGKTQPVALLSHNTALDTCNACNGTGIVWEPGRRCAHESDARFTVPICKHCGEMMSDA